MKYILECPEEANRLEDQSKQPGYQLKEELKHLALHSGEKVLDAGCGTGLAARFIHDQYPNAIVEGCDFSSIRIKQAKDIYSSSVKHATIKFFESPLESIPVVDSYYHSIVCRYVFEHLKKQQPVSNEFYRILKPGGKVHVIDFDGIIYNFYHANKKLEKMMTQIQKKLGLDLYIGRKIPHILKKSGFTDIKWEVTVVSFKGESLEAERKITEQRLAFALPIFAKILGSQTKALEFNKLYCHEMMKPESTLFYNKFIVSGIKQKAPLHLISKRY